MSTIGQKRPVRYVRSGRSTFELSGPSGSQALLLMTEIEHDDTANYAEQAYRLDDAQSLPEDRDSNQSS